MVYIVFLLVVVFTFSCESRLWARVPEMDDKFVSNGTESQQISKVRCALYCTNLQDCLSFFFDFQNSNCYLHTAVYNKQTPTSVVPGLKYFVPSGQVQPKCQAPYIWLTDACIQIVHNITMKTDWETARNRCIADGGDLFIPDSALKIDQMFPHLGEKSYYIGIYDCLSDGSYKFVDGRTQADLTFQKWQTGSAPDGPFNIFDLCGILKLGNGTYNWNDGFCYVSRYYICELH